MRNLFLFVIALLSFTSSDLFAQKKQKNYYVKLSTDSGSCIIRLYNSTPLHRDNFIKLTEQHFYDSLLFHRVIKGFMIQGGDPTSKNATSDKTLGDGDVGYTVPAEFKDSLFHRKGVLAAARDNNPAKASSGCQFYIVQGKKYTEADIDRVEQKRLNGYKIPAYQREIYKTEGGTPFLDQNYTVYGEVAEGLEMVDKIASTKTDKSDRPVQDIRMKVELLSKKEVRRFEKKLKKEKKPISAL
ncbi:peptidylprolyl isomerase [Solitalea sp. MAHUQ-68]|uniref:peptidylprolyl isomerase n=1 Tax=Solitalea agri TaxID=2953739 RepID=A0A9X2F247_9SPHI|nr:peptidylprolyl isomerase [Solitalea agri]MCO4292800.1 peptidylprolyl isomerase [Solitalea agri]